jgi:biotin carboxylase
MSRLLVLGAGLAQVDAIQRVKDLGHKLIAMDGDPQAPGLDVADQSFILDITDADEVIKVAQKLNIDGVISFSVEAVVKTVAEAAAALNLPGISPEAADNATSKKRMREIWQAKGIPSCRSICCRSLTAARDAVREIGFPLVLKPSDNAGSRGVSVIYSLSELDHFYEIAASFSRVGDILLEEFMAGEEMSVEGFICGGRFHLTGISDKIRTNPPYLLDLAVMFPSVKSQKMQHKAVQVVTEAALALGLDKTPIHAEIIATTQGPKMVELAARGPGFKVFTTMIPWSGGVDVVSEFVKIAIGEIPDIRMSLSRGAVLVFPQAKPGKVVSVKGVDAACAVPNIVDLKIYVKPGDTIYPLRSGADRIGHIIALADNRERAEEAVYQAEKNLLIDVIPSMEERS